VPSQAFQVVANHMKYLTRPGLTGLLNVMNLIMHPS